MAGGDLSISDTQLEDFAASAESDTRPSGRHPNALMAAAFAALFLLFGILVFAFWDFQQVKAANDLELRTYRILATSHELDEILTNESNALGAPRASRAGKRQVSLPELKQRRDSAIQDLKSAIIDPQAKATLGRIEERLLMWDRKFVAPSLVAARQGSTLSRLAIEESRVLYEQIRTQIELFEARERQLLDERRQNQEVLQTRAERLLLAGGAFGVLLTIGLISQLGRAARNSWASAQIVSASNRRLMAENRERRSAEAALRASEESYRLLADDSQDIICRHAPDATFIYISPAGSRLLGYPRFQMVGHSPFDLTHPDDLAKLKAYHQDILNLKKPNPVTYRMRKADGEYLWMETISHVMLDAETGRVLEIQSTSRDITRRREESEKQKKTAAGLRTLVDIADELLRSRDEDQLLRRAVELGCEKLNLAHCTIYLDEGDGRHLRGTYSATHDSIAVDESRRLFVMPFYWRNHPDFPQQHERFRLFVDALPQVLQSDPDRESYRVAPHWTTITVINAGDRDLGVFQVQGDHDENDFDETRQELVIVYCSVLGTLLDRVRAEMTRRTAESRLRTLIEKAPFMIYAVDNAERITLATGQALEIMDEPKGSFRPGMTLEQVQAGERSLEGVRRALRGEANREVINLRNRWFEIWREPLFDEAGVVNGMLGIGVDISERRQAELDRAESEARYRSVVESAREVIFRTDLNGRWTLLNPAWTDLLGYSIEESLARPILEFVVAEDRQVAELEVCRLPQRSETFSHTELRFQRRDGETRWMDLTARVDRDENGAPVSITGTLNDITERHRAESQLRATTALQNAILNGAGYAIFSCRADGTLQMLNRAAESLFGYRPAEVLFRQNPVLFCDAEDLKRRAAEVGKELGRPVLSSFDALTAKAKLGYADEFEILIRHQDGSTFPMRLSMTGLRGAEGRVNGYVGIGYDLSEVKRVDRLKNEFVSVVSHELRTPLTSIRGALGLLAGGVAGELPEKAGQMIDIARKNSERLVLLINDILDIEKIETGQMRFDMAQQDLRHIISAAVEANRPYANELGVQVHVDMPADEAPIRVWGDESRLIQVLTNLISNGAKFTPDGESLTVRCERLLSTSTNSLVRISVQDSGPGVPEEFLPRLFEKFAQADSSTTRHKGGTGLGLAIARAIVEKHEGEIGYLEPDETEGRRGATFSFDLPLITESETVTSQATEVRPRLLICEDDAEAAGFLSTILERAGYATDVVSSRQQALRALRTNHFAGMTLDLILPDGDGLDLLPIIRSDPDLEYLPVIVVSMRSKSGEIDASAVGVVDWLNKPIDPERLLLAVRQFGKRHEGVPHVLHVEDDADVRQITKAIIGEAAIVFEAANLTEARKQLEQDHFDLAILDIGLPDGSGLELIPLLNAASPPTPVILFSARETDDVQHHLIHAALVKSRTSNQALLETIQQSLTGN